MFSPNSPCRWRHGAGAVEPAVTFASEGRCSVLTLVPLGDTLIVLRNGGTKAVAFGIHFATAVVILITAGLLFAV